MNDTQESRFDPDDQEWLRDVDPDETLPPTRTATEPGVERPSAEYLAVSPEPEEVPTPRRFPSTSAVHQAPPLRQPPQPPRRRASPMLGCLTGLALILALASVALNAYLLYVLFSVQQTAVENLDTAIQAVDDFSGAGFHYEYKFNQDIPVAASIPIQQEMTIPFEGNFPINTTIEVPIDAGLLGTFVIDVPIDTNVYVNTQVPVNIDQTFDFSTSIPISMTVPIDVGTDDPEIEGVLTKVRQWLIDLRDSLSTGFIPSWVPIGE